MKRKTEQVVVFIEISNESTKKEIKKSNVTVSQDKKTKCKSIICHDLILTNFMTRNEFYSHIATICSSM